MVSLIIYDIILVVTFIIIFMFDIFTSVLLDEEYSLF